MSIARIPVLIFLAGMASTVIIGIIAAAVLIASGWFDVSASRPHTRIVSWLLHTTMIHSVQNRVPSREPFSSYSAQQVQEGFHLYDAHCAMCHGAPGVPRAAWVTGINPPPPYLLDAARRWSPAELKFIIANGIKMTAMPAWKLSRSDAEIASLVAFLEKLPDMSPAQYAKMRASAPTVISSAAPRSSLP